VGPDVEVGPYGRDGRTLNASSREAEIARIERLRAARHLRSLL
jgi:hypothetical protein